jgi:hypothetical protein
LERHWRRCRLSSMDRRLPLHSAESEQGRGSVTLRLASPEDGAALGRLVQLDSAASPTGPMLVAEAQGELVAAVPLNGGRVIANPFRPTAEVIRVLELRAAQLSDDSPGRARRFAARLMGAGRTPRAGGQPRAAER